MATLPAAAFAALLASSPLPGFAAKLDGVTLPDSTEVQGVKLHLNGIGLRTFSILKIHVYVAGLYLEHPSHDAQAILDSPEVKVMEIRFVHDASPERVRNAWQEGFDQNCDTPCRVPPEEFAKFLAASPGLHKGDVSTIVYTREAATISVNGKVLGSISDPAFMRVLLATFIGPHPPTERLKRELLALPE